MENVDRLANFKAKSMQERVTECVKLFAKPWLVDMNANRLKTAGFVQAPSSCRQQPFQKVEN